MEINIKKTAAQFVEQLFIELCFALFRIFENLAKSDQ